MPSSAATPDQTPAIAYGLYSQEPIRTPGGGLIMPDLPPEARERKAKLARLSESSSWAEIVLLDWFKRIAVFGVSASFDIERFERATQSLWRLTAVAKSIFALEDNPNIPIPTTLEPEVNGILSDASSLGARTSTSAPLSNPDNDSSLGPRTSTSADAPISHTPTDPLNSFSALRTPHSALESSALRTPHSALEIPALPSLAVRAVPACPTLSLNGIETYLNRTEADLAEAKRPTPPILDLPPTPDKSLPSHSLSPHSALATPRCASPSPRSALATPRCASLSPHSALATPRCASPSPHSALATPRCASPSPRSALHTPPLEDPYAACDAACVKCAKPFCALRLVVPFSHPSSPLQCDGTCRDCPKCRTCEYTTPARLRPG